MTTARAPRRRSARRGRGPARVGWSVCSTRSSPSSRHDTAAVRSERPPRVSGGPISSSRPRLITADPVGERLGLVEVVGREHDRGAPVLQRADQVPELPPRLGVEAGGRLVEEEQLGPADDPEGHVEPPALAAGELVAAGVALLGQADGLDHLLRRRAGRGSTRRSGATASATVRSARSLADCSTMPRRARQSRSPVVRVVAQHLDVPAVALAVALEDLHGRRLAGAVGAEQGDALADLDVEVEAVDGRQVAVVLGEAADADRAGHAPTLAPRRCV